MKRFILPILAAAVAGMTATSCLKKSDYENYTFYPNAVVTVKTSDAGAVYFQLDDETTLLPENIKKPIYDKEVRAFLNFSDKGPWTGANEESLEFDRLVYVNMLDSIRTKDAVVTLGSTGTDDDRFGTAPIEIVDNWYTSLEDNYLTVAFCGYWGDPRETHEINLVYGTDPSNPYLVELRHNPLEDTRHPADVQAIGVIAFRIDDIPGIDGKADHLDIKYVSFTGTKTVTIERNKNYYAPGAVKTKSSDEVSLDLPVK